MIHDSRFTIHVVSRAIVTALLAGLLTVASTQAATTFKRGTLIITQGRAKATLEVEVADTDESREQGLMNRAKMPENAGMLFVFESTGVWSFWMKNTLIPLTVAFIDDQWQIVDLVDMAVEQDPQNGPFVIYKAAKPSRYALEVNQGFFRRKNITVGAKAVYTPR